MEKTITIGWGFGKISFSDIDNEGEIEVDIDNGDLACSNIYLDKEKIITVRNHLNYILSKLAK